jgi:hypothetical protein
MQYAIEIEQKFTRAIKSHVSTVPIGNPGIWSSWFYPSDSTCRNDGEAFSRQAKEQCQTLANYCNLDTDSPHPLFHAFEGVWPFTDLCDEQSQNNVGKQKIVQKVRFRWEADGFELDPFQD